MDSGTDGVNSDIRALADLSDDDEETRVEQPSGCRIPGTNVYGTNIGHMVIEAMTEMARDDANFSENNYPDPVKQIAREIRRVWAENNARPVEQRASCQVPSCQCNGRADYMDWSLTETEDSDYEETEADIEESICSAIDDEFLTNEASPNSEQMVQPNTVTGYIDIY